MIAASAGAFRLGYSRGYAAAPAPPRGPAVRPEDTNRDGRPDKWTTVDERGVALSIATDRNNDGRPDKNELLVAGLRAYRVDFDEDFDGRYDRYDSMTREGYAILSHYDRDWDDAPERWVQRGGNGSVVSEWTDADENGAPERYREFDRQGRVTEEGIDADGDGLYEQQRFFNTHWPDPTRPMQVEHDDDRDGQFERHEEFRPDGTIERTQRDSNGDGRRDVIQYFDRQGLVVRKEGHDTDGDGNYELWRFPERNGVRLGYDDDDDRDIDHWDPPGAPAGWCAARCRVAAPAAAQP